MPAAEPLNARNVWRESENHMTDLASRAAIIGAAASLAGKGAHLGEVMDQAARIASMTCDRSAVAQVVDAITNPDSKVLVGHVIGVRKDPKSTRGVILLWTGTTLTYKYKIDGAEYTAPEGVEVVRTDRTDDNSGYGKRLALRLRDLIGHKVTVWVAMEEVVGSADNNKTRVVKHVLDLGLSEENRLRLAWQRCRRRPEPPHRPGARRDPRPDPSPCQQRIPRERRASRA